MARQGGRPSAVATTVPQVCPGHRGSTTCVVLAERFSGELERSGSAPASSMRGADSAHPRGGGPCVLHQVASRRRPWPKSRAWALGVSVCSSPLFCRGWDRLTLAGSTPLSVPLYLLHRSLQLSFQSLLKLLLCIMTCGILSSTRLSGRVHLGGCRETCGCFRHATSFRASQEGATDGDLRLLSRNWIDLLLLRDMTY